MHSVVAKRKMLLAGKPQKYKEDAWIDKAV